MNNQILVVVGADGRILHTEQDGVFRRSNKQNELVALLDFPSASVVKVNFIRADGVKPGSQYMQWIGEQIYEGATYNAYSYFLTDYQLYATGPLVASLDISNRGVKTTSGDFTIDVEASEGACGADTPTDPNQYDEALKVLMRTDVILLDRTANVPNLVADIQKVADNAFTFTNNSGVESAPIVLGNGESAPIPENTASKVVIPTDSWQPTYAADQTTVTGYTYIVTAGLHGQMRDGATANDLWVSFDETDGTTLLGAFKRYTVDTAGNITVYVNQPVTLTVRVWNGKSLADMQARELVAQETARAEAEEQKLQEQIMERQNTGVDTVAREQIAAANEQITELNTRVQTLEDNTVAFTAETWMDTPAETAYLGAVCKAIELPKGKRIVQVVDENNMPRGTWQGNTIYANYAFAGVAIIM